MDYVKKWAEVANEITSVAHPLSKQELAKYCEEKLAGKWHKCKKVAKVKVLEKATPGEVYVTVTRDENGGTWEETKNTAKDGQFLVCNFYDGKDVDDPSKWLLDGSKIKKAYAVNGEVEVGKVYSPVGEVRLAAKADEDLSFVAPWGEVMRAKKGDWIVRNGEGYDDIYRIERVVFENTYKTLD